VRELYLYWKLAPADEPAARQALAVWQQALCRRHPGLLARVLRRLDEGGAAQLTLMEVYAQPPHGVSDALLQTVRDEGDALLAPWCAGRRHLEVFSSTSG
jgi:hypothetical protein